MTAYNQNDLMITIRVEKDPMNPGTNTLNMTAYNNGQFNINEFLFQAAVPKVTLMI